MAQPTPVSPFQPQAGFQPQAPQAPEAPPIHPQPTLTPDQVAKDVARTWKRLRDRQFKDEKKQRDQEYKLEEEMKGMTGEPDPFQTAKIQLRHQKKMLQLQGQRQLNRQQEDFKRQEVIEAEALKAEKQQMAEETKLLKETLKEQNTPPASAQSKEASTLQPETIPADQTGPAAILGALARMDLDKMEEEQKEIIRNGPKTKRPLAVSRLNYIQGLRRNKIRPDELMVSKVPVLPPGFRPYVLGDTLMPGDLNMLYKDLLEVRGAHRQAKQLFGADNVGDSRLALYDAVKATYGYGDAVNPKLREKQVGGAMAQLLDKGAKYSVVQRRLLSKTQDSVGRSTIVPDPDLTLDQIGLPEDIAWDIYGSVLRKRLVRMGETPASALRQARDRSDKARTALLQEMKERPVIYSRAPAWHKFNTLGAYPVLREDNAIAVNPATTAGQNADFDGDSSRLCIRIVINIDVVEAFLRSNPAMKFNNLNILKYNGRGTGVTIRIEDIPHSTEPVSEKENGCKEYTVPDGVHVLSYDIDTGVVAWKPVTLFSYHPNLTMYSVKVGNDSFLASDDQSLIAFNPDTNRVEKMDPLSTQKTNKYNLMAPVSWRKNQSNNYMDVVSVSQEFPKVSLTSHLGFAIGVYLGDGCFSIDYKRFGREYPYAVYLYGGAADSSRRKIKTHGNAIKTFSDIFDINGKIQYNEYERESLGGVKGNSGRTSLNHGDNDNLEVLYKWLKDTVGTGAENKKLPAFTFQANEEFRWGLLCGLLASDGTICVTHGKAKPQLTVAYGTTSPELANDFQALCASLNIGCGLTEDKRKTPTGKTPYILSVSTISLAKRYKETPFTVFCEEKDELLKEYLPTIRLENTVDRVPFPGGALGTALKYASWEHSGKPVIKGNKKNLGKANIWVSRRCWNRTVAQEHKDIFMPYLSEKLQKEFEAYYTTVLNPEITWEMIYVSPEPLVMDAYDLTVPGPYTFASANGTFVQDTVNVHLPILPDAVRDVKEKLMGSKQLLTIRNPDTVMPVVKHEEVLGIFEAQKNPSGKRYIFPDESEVLKALKSGAINLNDDIDIDPSGFGPPMG